MTKHKPRVTTSSLVCLLLAYGTYFNGRTSKYLNYLRKNKARTIEVDNDRIIYEILNEADRLKPVGTVLVHKFTFLIYTHIMCTAIVCLICLNLNIFGNGNLSVIRFDLREIFDCWF